MHEGTYRSDMYPMRTRFLNLFGNPSNIGCAGTICRCNTIAINYALLGMCQLSGQGPPDGVRGAPRQQRQRHTSPLDWQRLREAAWRPKRLKVIVIDPRKTEAGRYADLWLQLRPGTDTALFMAWINVIIEEGLYDKAFVEEWTSGFDELRARAAEYTPERVAEITWVPAGRHPRVGAHVRHQQAGRASTGARATDMFGRNSIRVEQARICLRALTGNLAEGGGEMVVGPGPIIDGTMGVRDSMLVFPEMISRRSSATSRSAPTGSSSWAGPATRPCARYHEETYGVPFPTAAHNFVAVQPLIWKAILEKDPYPVTAMITWGSNVLLNGGDVQTMYRALKSPNLELHVVMEHFMTPTALLADYVLPIASKLEKPMCATHEDFAPNIACSEAAVEPLGERRGDYLRVEGPGRAPGLRRVLPLGDARRSWPTSGWRRLASLSRRWPRRSTSSGATSPGPTRPSIPARAGPPASPRRRARWNSTRRCWSSWATTRCPTTRSPRRAQ